MSPFYLLSSLDPVSEVFVVENEITRDFVAKLRAILATIGVPLTPILHDEITHDVWMQDTVEIGYRVEANGDLKTVALGGLRGKHNPENIVTAPLDEKVKRHLRERRIEVLEIAEPRANARWIDWYGNLEVSPPVLDAAGNDYPQGRILTGWQHELTLHPDALAFLESQSVQTPVVSVNVSWLTVGHVDEIINFVPADNAKGFKVLLPSPSVARYILQDAFDAGYGKLPVFAGTKEEITLETLLNETANSSESIAIDREIAKTQTQLSAELGLDSTDYALLPALFQEGIAVIPNPVNCLVVNGHAILPAPCGAKRDGADLFERAIRETLESSKLTLHFLDIWDTYHVRAGEIHCGTNAIRSPRFLHVSTPSSDRLPSPH